MNRTLNILGYINRGFEGQAIGIECDVRNGFPGFDIVGLPDSSVKESKERVRTALRNSGFKFPQNRILISLSPASQPKSGSLLDLGIALSLLFASTIKDKLDSQIKETLKIMVAGELKLNGEIVQTSEALGAIECSRKNNCSICLLPYDLSDFQGNDAIQVTNLVQAFLTCGELLNNNTIKPTTNHQQKTISIFSDVIGLNKEKELLAMASSGFHSILMFGPPGVGKTMLSNKIHYLLPELTKEEKEEVKRIYSCTSTMEEPTIPTSRLLSHDITAIQFNSGSSNKAPGEGALCHKGTLILDEANKYSPKLLQAVQSAYDCGVTQNSKGGELLTYPSRFLMIANLNPCPCGSLGNPSEICTCTSQKIDSHWKHLGWQFIDRFDLRIPIKIQDGYLNANSKPDSYYIEKIKISSDRQRIRYKYIEDVNFNGEVHFNTQALRYLQKELEVFKSLKDVPNLNPRALFSIIALSRTIADYDDRDNVNEEDLRQALTFRTYCHGDYYWRQLY